MTAQQHAATTQGIANGLNYIRDAPERDARRAEAEVRQQRAEMQTSPAGKQAAENEMELMIRQQQSQINDLRRKESKREAYQSFDKYQVDFDVRHLNNMLGKQRELAPNSFWGEVSRFEPMTDTPETRRLLEQQGFENPEEFFAEDEDGMRNSKVMATFSDGSHRMVDLDDLYIGTQYNVEMSDMQRQMLENRKQMKDSVRDMPHNDYSYADELYRERMNAWEEEGRSGDKPSRLQALRDVKNQNTSKAGPKGRNPSEREQFIEKYMAKNEGATEEDARKAYAASNAKPTGDIIELAAVDELNKEYDAKYGGHVGDADMSDDKVRRDVADYVRKYEKLTGIKLDSSEKKVYRQIRQLITAGGVAGEDLSEKEAGFFDQAFRSVKKYFSNDIGGKEGEASYEAFRNIMRNALFGAALSRQESKNFEKAAGSLGQKIGPVLSQLKVQMTTVKDQLQSLLDTTDPRVASYYFGKSSEDIELAIDALEDRLEYFDNYKVDGKIPKVTQNPNPISRVAAPTVSKDKQERLDAFFGGAK